MTELPQSAVQLRRTLSLPMITLYGISTTVGAGNRHTRTPITATAAVVGAVLVFALALPLEDLAQLTSLVVLVVFALLNVALAVLKMRQSVATDAITVPIWIPIAGLLSARS